MSIHAFRLGALVTALPFLLAGCGGGGTTTSSTAGSSTATVFAANLRTSITAGIANQAGTTVASAASWRFYGAVQNLLGIRDAMAQTATDTVQPDIALGDFVSVDANGNVARIFNYSFPIYSIQQTTNYLIVDGTFVSPTDSSGNPLIVDSAGSALQCYLYAIKKTANGSSSDIQCLSSVPVGSFDPSLAPTNAHYAHLGFATRGNSVYYTVKNTGTLYKWSEGDGKASPIFQQTPIDPSVGMDDVYLDAGGNDICVLYSALSLASGSVYYGGIYCGTDSGLTSTLTGTSTAIVLAESRQLGNNLLVGSHKINLATLTVSPTIANGSNFGLPSGYSNIFTTASGQTIQRAYAWSLSTTDANGNTCLLATTNGLTNTGCTITSQTINSYFQAVLGLGTYTWAYGTSNPNDPTTGNYLARIDNSNVTLSGANFMTQAGMSSITGMSYTTDGRIVITGKDSSGNVSYAYIDTAGVITASSTPPTFRLSETASF